jgi:hypothetical protein
LPTVYMKWSNSRKCLYWQLVVGGIPTSARHNITGASCYCTAMGHDCPDRTHHFWQCPAAAAVAVEICICLGVPQPHRKQLWLMELPDEMGVASGQANAPPSGSVRGALKEVWMVVCLTSCPAGNVGHSKESHGPQYPSCAGSTAQGVARCGSRQRGGCILGVTA